MFTAALFTVAKKWKQAKGYIMERWYTYTLEYCSAIRRMKSCHFKNTDELREVMLRKLSSET
jgi:hypothetical protein